jgi:hypothetical protein
MSTLIDPTPDQVQHEAVTYFRTMDLPGHIVLEVWSVDEDSGVMCLDPRCFKVGFVHISNQSYCLGHAALVIMGMPDASRRHISVDVARPILVPRELTEQQDVIQTTIRFLQFVTARSGSSVTTDMARRARGLISLLSKHQPNKGA